MDVAATPVGSAPDAAPGDAPGATLTAHQHHFPDSKCPRQSPRGTHCLSQLQRVLKQTHKQYLKAQERGPGAAGDELEQFALLLVGEALHDAPEGPDHRVVGRVAP